MTLPARIAPMKAVSGPLPPDEERWAYEIKWDGMRVLAFLDRGRVRLQSANLREVTARFPELHTLGPAFAAHQIVLDGEVVVVDEGGRTSFQALQTRMHVDDPTEAKRLAGEVPIVYLAFDLLHLDGNDVMPLAYLDRRRLLGRLVEPGAHWSVPAHRRSDGAPLLEASRHLGLEGIVAKRIDSHYEPGRRSAAWRKVKNRRRQEVVVGGWVAGERSRAATLGALLVGVHEGGELRYAGRVGTGFTHDDLDRWMSQLAPLATPACPFAPAPPAPARRGAHWVEPRLVIEVAFGEWTSDGVLRHPSYLGRRTDKDPADVVREP